MRKTIAIAASALLLVVFGVTVGILLQVLPGPHKPTDYLVIGAVATLLGSEINDYRAGTHSLHSIFGY